jgi:hypothetical protein
MSWFLDASFNLDTDAKSVTGYAFTSAGGAVTWGSRKQGLMALLATEAECLALTKTMQEAMWLRTLLDNLSLKQMVPTSIEEDNQGTIALTENPQFHQQSKYYICEKIAEKAIEVNYCATGEMTADVLTQSLAKPVHNAHVKRLGMALD